MGQTSSQRHKLEIPNLPMIGSSGVSKLVEFRNRLAVKDYQLIARRVSPGAQEIQ